jgi:hypothetical protein
MFKNSKIAQKNENSKNYSIFYMSTISSCSNEPSNSSNSSSKPKSDWINSTKLEGSFHPSLRSLGQFFLVF